MNSVLTSITGTFGKRILVASFLPVLLTAVLLYSLYGDLSLETAGDRIVALSAGNTALTLMGIIIVAFLLHTLNVPILRLFEGYPWRNTCLGKCQTDLHQKRFERADNRQKALRRVQGLFENGSEERTQATEVRSRTKSYLKAYPFEQAHILPTRLGNVIRRAETYSYDQYGIDSVVIWPRLVKVIDSDYRVMLQEARIGLDFCVNMALLLATTGAISLFAFFLQLGTLTFGTLWGSALLFVSAGVMYGLSLGRAEAWGEMIKAAIDLFRWDLLDQLGIHNKPDTMTEERKLWLAISRQLYHGDFIDINLVARPRLEYRKPSTQLPHVTTETGDAKLRVSKSFFDRRWDGFGVKLRIENLVATPADSVKITDCILPGYVYVSDSATVSGKDVRVEGSGPYTFSIPAPIAANTAVTLEYSITLLHN